MIDYDFLQNNLQKKNLKYEKSISYLNDFFCKASWSLLGLIYLVDNIRKSFNLIGKLYEKKKMSKWAQWEK